MPYIVQLQVAVPWYFTSWYYERGTVPGTCGLKLDDLTLGAQRARSTRNANGTWAVEWRYYP